MSDIKEFTHRQVYILLFIVIASIAFIESSGPTWTWGFWRDFLSNVFAYILIVIIAVGLFQGLIFRNK